VISFRPSISLLGIPFDFADTGSADSTQKRHNALNKIPAFFVFFIISRLSKYIFFYFACLDTISVRLDITFLPLIFSLI
jgi:hypothetical protein